MRWTMGAGDALAANTRLPTEFGIARLFTGLPPGRRLSVAAASEPRRFSQFPSQSPKPPGNSLSPPAVWLDRPFPGSNWAVANEATTRLPEFPPSSLFPQVTVLLRGAAAAIDWFSMGSCISVLGPSAGG